MTRNGARVAARTRKALADWKRITDVSAFFEQNRRPNLSADGPACSDVDFSEPDRFFGEDALNMLPRLRERFV